MKKCPYCGEVIQDAAIKCKYCKEWLPESAAATESKLTETPKQVDIIREEARNDRYDSPRVKQKRSKISVPVIWPNLPKFVVWMILMTLMCVSILSEVIEPDTMGTFSIIGACVWGIVLIILSVKISSNKYFTKWSEASAWCILAFYIAEVIFLLCYGDYLDMDLGVELIQLLGGILFILLFGSLWSLSLSFIIQYEGRVGVSGWLIAFSILLLLMSIPFEESITIWFYVCFWGLSIYSIWLVYFCPKFIDIAYSKEGTELKNSIIIIGRLLLSAILLRLFCNQ